MKIIDAHTHIFHEKENASNLFALTDSLDIGGLNILSLQCCGMLTQNTAVASAKTKRPNVYAFASLDHVTGRSYREQAELYLSMGYDGIKMLEGKPTTRKELGLALDDPLFDPFYSFLEEKQFPVLLHVADPPTFWDKDLCPDWAVEQGWFYDETHVPFARYYEEVENLLNKHPKLPAIFAHFYFLSDCLEQSQKFLDKHPCAYIDITAGVEMYENFSKNPQLWREFFIKNEKRIIFGTDSTDEALPKEGGEYALNSNSKMELDFLRTDQTFDHFRMKISGINLPDGTLERILYKNFYELTGAPKPMDKNALLKEANYLRAFIKDEKQLEIMDELVKNL